MKIDRDSAAASLVIVAFVLMFGASVANNWLMGREISRITDQIRVNLKAINNLEAAVEENQSMIEENKRLIEHNKKLMGKQ